MAHINRQMGDDSFDPIRTEPMAAIIDDNLALTAFGRNIIILEDRFRTGYECRTCDGEAHTKEPCKKCKGTKSISHEDWVNEEKVTVGLMPCNACLIVGSFGNKVPCGFVPCEVCKGMGATLVVPEESIRRPSSGRIVSIGEEVQSLKCGDRVLYTNHSGYAMNFKQQTVFRVMQEQEVLAMIRGVGDFQKSLS